MIKRTTWIVVAVFLAVLGAAVYIQRQPLAPETALTEAAPTAAAPLANLLPVTMSEISGLRLEETATGDAVELRLDEQGAWQLLEPPEGPADASEVESFLSTLTNLRVQTSLEAAPDLSVFGLAAPAYRLSVETAGGETLTVLVGDQTPTASGYYVRVDGNLPQVVNKFSLDSFLRILAEPPELEEIEGEGEPTPVPDEDGG
jgi:hypothetical protein